MGSSPIPTKEMIIGKLTFWVDEKAKWADGGKPHLYEGNGLDRPLSLLRFTFGADEGKSHSRV